MKRLIFFCFLALATIANADIITPGGTSVLVPQKFVTGTDNATTDTAALQAAIDALGVNGGVIQTSGTVSIDWSGITYPSLSKSLTFEVYGSWRTATTSPVRIPNNVNWIGKGGAQQLQFQRGPTAGIIPPSGTGKTLVISGSNTHTIKNLAITGNNGIGIYLDGVAALGALANLENVAVSPADVATGYGLVADAWFWLWLRDCSFLASTNNPYSIRVTTSNSAFSQAGIVHLTDSVIAGKGIQIDAQVAVSEQGNFMLKDTIYESALGPLFTLDGTNGAVTNVVLDHVAVADAVSIASVINIVAGTVRNVTIKNSDSLMASASLPLVAGGSIESLDINGRRSQQYANGYSNGTVQKNWTRVHDGMFEGAWSGRGATMGPSIVPYASLGTNQDVTTWGAATGSATVTTGISAPDGSTTAATLSSGAGTQSRRVLELASQSLAVGDWILVGVWMRSEDGTVPAYSGSAFTPTAGSPATFTNGSSTLGITNEASQRLGASWTPVVVAGKVATSPSGTYTFLLDLKTDATHPTSYWMPWVMKIPAAAGDEEALRVARYITNVPASMAAGTLAMFSHQSWTNAALVTPKITTGLKDVNGNTMVGYTPTASAVDYLNVTNGATGNPATITLAAAGSDSNIHLSLNPKGSGEVKTTAQTYRTSYNGTAYFVSLSGNPIALQPGGNNSYVFVDGTNFKLSGNNDTGIWRNAAGVVEANNGTAGTFREFKGRAYLYSGVTFANLPTAAAGIQAYITDGLAGSCGDGTCTTWGTTVTAGGGALKLLVWYNGTNWTLIGK